MIKDHTKYLRDLYERHIIGNNEEGLYYCNPIISVNTKNGTITFDIAPQLVCYYGTFEYFRKKNVNIREVFEIERKLGEICVFELSHSTVEYIIYHLAAMGWIETERTDKEEYREYLHKICDYDFTHFDEMTFPVMPGDCEGYLNIDGKNIF